MSRGFEGIVVTTYEELEKLVGFFREGDISLLIVMSAPGLGKTTICKGILKRKVHRMSTHVTPLGFYQEIHEHLDENLWLDDVEALFQNDKMIGILKQLCELLPEKEVQYNTSWDIKKTRNIPKRLSTTSSVLLTINSLSREKNENMRAIIDRGILIDFKPNKEELTRYILKNFEKPDKEVLKFLNADGLFSLRDYVKCNDLKKAGYERWKEARSGRRHMELPIDT